MLVNFEKKINTTPEYPESPEYPNLAFFLNTPRRLPSACVLCCAIVALLDPIIGLARPQSASRDRPCEPQEMSIEKSRKHVHLCVKQYVLWFHLQNS